MKPIELKVNGEPVQALVEPRTHLADFLRDQQRLTGTHLGCEHGVCGACTVVMNGAAVRSCLLLAAAANADLGDDPYSRRLHAVALRRAIEKLAA